MTSYEAPPGEIKLSLRERMPDYLALFGSGLGVAAVVGLLVLLMTDRSFLSGFGYALIAIAVLMLLAGGVSGGGYANLGVGALGTMFGSQLRTPEGDSADDDPEELRRQVFGGRGDPRERLRKGLRPEANPRAFWQVVGGFVYFVLGTWIVIQFAS
ncbi:MAG: hypothetical protein HKN91_14895 [Acidimicrobiia bacterium]|nr:hypothetical protein [Acidimicrobiia bacterium]